MPPTRRVADAAPALRATRVLLLVACALALAGCATLLGRRADERAVTIDLRLSRTEAVRRTLAAFRDQGYTIRPTLTSGSEPETEPFRHRDAAEAVFRAAVTGSGRRSRVVLTGTYRRRQLAGLVRGPEREVRASDDPVERELWARLENLAMFVRRPPSGP